MESKITVPHVPFYFVRHGKTDWNKLHQALCNQDDIPLNETGLLQATNVRKQMLSLGITKIYASPLMRTKQTAEIINDHLAVPLELHEGLREVSHGQVATAFTEILDPFHTMLIVSHGNVYHVLLSILNAQATELKARNCGLYFFRPPTENSDQWLVHAVNTSDE